MLATLSHIKRAAPVGSSDRSFETSLSNLAFSTIRDRAPGLLDHLVGFQLLEKNDESTKASGIFGFQLGDQWLYAPIFFMNGDLKGSELLYLKNQDLFVPMKENWINYVLNRKPPVLGEGVNRNSRLLGVMQPNLTSFARPAGLKYANSFPDWALHGLTGLARARQTMKYAGIDLPTFLKRAGRPAIRTLLVWCQEYPKLAAAIEKFHGFEKLFGESIKVAGAAEVAQPSKFDNLRYRLGRFVAGRHQVPDAQTADNMARIMTGLGLSPDAVRDMSPLEIAIGTGAFRDESLSPETETKDRRKRAASILPPAYEPLPLPDVQILAKQAADQLPLSDEDTQTLLRDGCLIRDKRADHQVSRAYAVPVHIKHSARLTNPTITGIFQVLVRPGDFEEMLVIVHPYAENTRKHMATAVRLDKERNWINTDPSNVWIQPETSPAAETHWFDDLPRSSAIHVDGNYVAVTKSGQGTTPFKVQADMGKFDGQRSYRVSFRSCLAGPVPRYRRPSYRNIGYPDDHEECRLHLRTKPGTKMRQFGADLFLPEGTKLISIYTPPQSKDCCCPTATGDDGYSKGHDPAPILLGNWLDVRRTIFEKTSALKLSHDGTVVELNGRQLSPRDAVNVLVLEHGLRVKAAQAVLVAAQRQQKIDLRIKYAAPYPLQQSSPVAPTIEDPIMGGMSDQSGYAQVQQSQTRQIPIDGVQGMHTDPSVYDATLPPLQTNQMITPGPSTGTMQAANSAAQTGQREIFDTAVIGGLLRSGRPESMVRDFSGDILKAMDKLGRLYFSSLHRPDDWENLYGKTDAHEVRDAILNSFESLGDVVLYLKEQQIGDIDERLSPNVEQVAEEE